MSAPGRAQQLRLRENQLFLVLTIVIGVLAGLAAVLFTVAIEQTTHRLFGLAPSRLRLFAVAPLMSLVTGFLLAKVFPDVRGSGVPQTEAAYHLSGGVIPSRVPIGKFITGVLCIGSGHSMGREGPSVQIGAGLASMIGRWLRLPPHRVRDLVPVGAAGALAAAFNTPIAAVLFALEEIIGDMNASLLGSTVVASVAAVIVERSILGNEPLFHVPTYRLVHPAELIAYAALGILGGGVSLLFCKGLLVLRGLFLRLPPRTKIFQPALGGLVIGAILHALLHHVHLPLPAPQTLAASRTARHVMQTDVSLIPPGVSVEHAWKMAVEHGAPAYLVGTRDRLVGAVSHRQLEDARTSGRVADPVGSIVDPSFAHAHADQPIDVVLERFAQSDGILPVVSRADVHRLEGVITADSIRRFAEGLARKRESPQTVAGGPDADSGNQIH